MSRLAYTPTLFSGIPFDGPSPGLLSTTYPDLLSSIIGYLRTAPTITAVFGVGWGQGGWGMGGWGEIKVYDEEADPAAYPPFLVLTGYTESLPGESLEDQVIQLTAIIVTNDLDQARDIGGVVKAALDTPAINARAVGRPPFTFRGGQEYGLLRNNSRPRKLRGMGKGNRYVYAEEIDYFVHINPEQ